LGFHNGHFNGLLESLDIFRPSPQSFFFLNQLHRLHLGIFTTYVSTGHDNVAVELAADFNAIFFDSGLGANLKCAVFDNLNQIDRDDFFERHDISLFPATASTVALRLVGRTSTVSNQQRQQIQAMF
jgi:hypothetical protein